MENAPSNESSPLEAFRAEIRERAAAEAAVGKTGHFLDIPDIDQLTDEDRAMWELVNADWREAAKKTHTYQNAIPKDLHSRRGFAAFINNYIMDRQWAEIQAEKSKPE